MSEINNCCGTTADKQKMQDEIEALKYLTEKQVSLELKADSLINWQKEEIADLKSQVENIETLNDSISELQDQRINKLVKALKEIQKLPSSRMDEGSTIAFLAIKANTNE